MRSSGAASTAECMLLIRIYQVWICGPNEQHMSNRLHYSNEISFNQLIFDFLLEKAKNTLAHSFTLPKTNFAIDC